MSTAKTTTAALPAAGAAEPRTPPAPRPQAARAPASPQRAAPFSPQRASVQSAARRAASNSDDESDDGDSDGESDDDAAADDASDNVSFSFIVRALGRSDLVARRDGTDAPIDATLLAMLSIASDTLYGVPFIPKKREFDDYVTFIQDFTIEDSLVYLPKGNAPKIRPIDERQILLGLFENGIGSDGVQHDALVGYAIALIKRNEVDRRAILHDINVLPSIALVRGSVGYAALFDHFLSLDVGDPAVAIKRRQFNVGQRQLKLVVPLLEERGFFISGVNEQQTVFFTAKTDKKPLYTLDEQDGDEAGVDRGGDDDDYGDEEIDSDDDDDASDDEGSDDDVSEASDDDDEATAIVRDKGRLDMRKVFDDSVPLPTVPKDTKFSYTLTKEGVAVPNADAAGLTGDIPVLDARTKAALLEQHGMLPPTAREKMKRAAATGAKPAAPASKGQTTTPTTTTSSQGAPPKKRKPQVVAPVVKTPVAPPPKRRIDVTQTPLAVPPPPVDAPQGDSDSDGASTEEEEPVVRRPRPAAPRPEAAPPRPADSWSDGDDDFGGPSEAMLEMVRQEKAKREAAAKEATKQKKAAATRLPAPAPRPAAPAPAPAPAPRPAAPAPGPVDPSDASLLELLREAKAEYAAKKEATRQKKAAETLLPAPRPAASVPAPALRPAAPAPVVIDIDFDDDGDDVVDTAAHNRPATYI